MFSHSSRETHGIRKWWHFGEDRRCIGVEFYWWSHRCGASVSTDDDGWNVSLRVPPFALYISIEGFPLWQPTRTCIATWDNNRPFTIPDRRECEVSIANWTIRVTPWGRWGEWRAGDAWWTRGVSLDLKRLVLGKTRYRTEVVSGPTSIVIPMPEGRYAALATVKRREWKRSRWFAHGDTFVDVEIPKGIPFAGKGENSYDCDDDGLFGYSSRGASIESAIAKGVESVLVYRRKYGEPSGESIRAATL